MGRWGDGLFESDGDLDAIDDIFDDEMRKPLKKDVIRLRLKAWEQEQLEKKSGEGKLYVSKANSEKAEKRPSKKELQKDWESWVGLYHPECPRFVRDYLDSGVLASLIKTHGPEKPNARWSEYHGHKNLVLIAFCAMELGCTLPHGFLARLKSNYHRVGLCEVEREQIRRACDEYVDGKPYDFVSVGLVATACMIMNGDVQRPEPRPPGLESIPSEEATITTDEPTSKRRKLESKATTPAPVVDESDLIFPADTCANCGATQGHGTPDLQRCKGCKTTLYCFDGCQKWHWFRHRRHCKVDNEVEEPAKDESTDKDGNNLKEEVEKTTA